MTDFQHRMRHAREHLREAIRQVQNAETELEAAEDPVGACDCAASVETLTHIDESIRAHIDESIRDALLRRRRS